MFLILHGRAFHNVGATTEKDPRVFICCRTCMFSGYKMEKQEGAWMMYVVDAMECEM